MVIYHNVICTQYRHWYVQKVSSRRSQCLVAPIASMFYPNKKQRSSSKKVVVVVGEQKTCSHVF